MTPAVNQIKQANSQIQALNSAAEAAGALVSDIGARISLINDRIKGLQSAVLLGSAPRSIAFTSGEHLQLTSTKNTMMNAGQHLDIGAMKNLSLSAAKALPKTLILNGAGSYLKLSESGVEHGCEGVMVRMKRCGIFILLSFWIQFVQKTSVLVTET